MNKLLDACNFEAGVAPVAQPEPVGEEPQNSSTEDFDFFVSRASAAELRCAAIIQRNAIDELRQCLRNSGDRIDSLRAALELIEPYIRDKKVTGKKPLRNGLYTIHLGQVARDALEGRS